MVPEPLEQCLVAFLTARLPGVEGIRVSLLGRTASGFSRENWPFDAEWREGRELVRRRLLLRRDPPGGLSVIETDRQSEFRVLRALEGTHVPAPKVYWVEHGSEWLGRPFLIMERCEGTVDPKVLTEGGSLGLDRPRRLRLAERYCELLAGIHRLDWEALGLRELGVPAGNPAEAELERTIRFVERAALEPQPELVEVICWLERRIPAANPLVLVHGDFRPENSMVREDDVAVVLDWELARISDPMADLGWYMLPINERLHFVPGAWEPADFLRRYGELTGLTIEEECLHFWKVLTMLYVTGIVTAAAKSFVEGRSPFAAMTAGSIRRFAGILCGMIGT